MFLVENESLFIAIEFNYKILNYNNYNKMEENLKERERERGDCQLITPL